MRWHVASPRLLMDAYCDAATCAQLRNSPGHRCLLHAQQCGHIRQVKHKYSTLLSAACNEPEVGQLAAVLQWIGLHVAVGHKDSRLALGE